MAFELNSLAMAARLRCMRAGVVRDQLDCKPQPRGSRECGQLEILCRESTKPLTRAAPNENKVGLAAAIQSGALKPGDVLPACVPLAPTEFHGHIRFKII